MVHVSTPEYEGLGNTEMAVKFVPVMTKYVQRRGGPSTPAPLEKALKNS